MITIDEESIAGMAGECDIFERPDVMRIGTGWRRRDQTALQKCKENVVASIDLKQENILVGLQPARGGFFARMCLMLRLSMPMIVLHLIDDRIGTASFCRWTFRGRETFRSRPPHRQGLG